MSTTQQLTVYKGYPTKITIKANGYYDYKTTKTFTTAGETVNIPSTEMTVYDGLDCSFSTASNNLYLADFSDTTLPNENTPSPTLYAMKASGQTYPIPSAPVYNNYTIVGNPSINTSTGVVSGFSSENYLTLPQSLNPGNNPWEVKLKITTSYDVSSVQGVFQTITAYSENGQYGIIFLIYDGKTHFAVSTDGSSFMFNKSGSLNLSTNATYWIKFGWTGTEYYLEYSTDGTNYTRDITENSSTPAYSSSNYTLFGIYSWSVKQSFQGTLDLSECYIKVNNSIWWEADSHPYVQVEGCLYNYTDDGSAVTLNAYQTGTSIILTPDVSYNGIKLGTVNVPSHSV